VEVWSFRGSMRPIVVFLLPPGRSCVRFSSSQQATPSGLAHCPWLSTVVEPYPCDLYGRQPPPPCEQSKTLTQSPPAPSAPLATVVTLLSSIPPPQIRLPDNPKSEGRGGRAIGVTGATDHAEDFSYIKVHVSYK
jgi:hypothetical protein